MKLYTSNSFKFNSDQGQSLFEVVVALAVIALIVVSIVVLATNSIKNTSFSNNKTLATKYSQEVIEWLRGERDADWDEFYSHTSTLTWCLKTLSWNLDRACSSSEDMVAGTNLKRELLFIPVNLINIETKIRIYWNDNQGLHEVNTVTNFTDWRKE